MDAVLLSVIDSRLTQIAREMGITLMKTSYSTIFNEGLDFSCGLSDLDGNLIGTAEFNPSQIGGLPLLMRSCILEIPLDTIDEGDIIVHNDPYRGGMHTPEHTFIKPVFVDGTLIGFALAVGHIAEVGGMAPGGFAAEATEVFQEGLRVPPVKIKRRGEDVEDIWKVLLANYRTPRQNYGDFRALISAVDLGAAQLAELAASHGVAEFRRITHDLLDYSEARMRAEIASFPTGVYSYEDTMEDDGIGDRPYRIAVDVFVRGDEVVVDFHRSDRQALGPINAVLSVAWSASYNAILHLTDATIPKNSGCFRPIRIVAPPGTVVNCDFPAPEVGGNTETHIRICYAIIAALSRALPGRAFASDGGTHSNFLFGGYNPRTHEYVVCYDFTSTGWGARSFADGNNAVNCINGNSRMSPVEVFETRFPWLVESYGLVPDTGGAGHFRGGLSIEKRFVCRDTEITLSVVADRHKTGPFGLFGGSPGGLGAYAVERAGATSFVSFTVDSGKRSPSKFSNVRINAGDRVMIRTPGGGGYGPPAERSSDLIALDLEEGLITTDGCRRDYHRDPPA